jgi:hypothetical protein
VAELIEWNFDVDYLEATLTHFLLIEQIAIAELSPREAINGLRVAQGIREGCHEQGHRCQPLLTVNHQDGRGRHSFSAHE